MSHQKAFGASNCSLSANKQGTLKIMGSGSDQAHWESIYAVKSEAEVSWFQETPTPSLELFDLIDVQPFSAIIDIGGGESRLVDSLLGRGFESITVLDLSERALAETRARLSGKGTGVEWIVADVTEWQPSETYDVWHDRAAFHFLTHPSQQAAYIQRLKAALRHGGHAIIGTFALDGPDKCSGLPVARHSAESIAALLGADFTLIDSRGHEHKTPWQAVQRFQFSTFHRVA
jgi:2-polyprenyl-3-methyl-5-hydroxy-6-metoxy-1,4-benzoquinol methylase